MTAEVQKTNQFIGLSIIRFIFGLIILKNIIFYLPTSDYYFGKNGIVPWEDFLLICGTINMSFMTIFFQNDLMLKIYLLLTVVLAFNFCLGIGSTINGVALTIFLFFLKLRNGLILDGSDNVISVVLPFLIFTNCYRFFNVQLAYDKLEQVLRSKDWMTVVDRVFVLAIKIQVIFVYFFTAIAKSGGVLWQNGTAVYYTMRVKEFNATSLNVPLTQNVYFVVFTTYTTQLIEIAFAFLVWFKKTKFIILTITALLHVGIFIFMRIDNFSWVMITTYAVFINDDEFLSIHKGVKLRISSFLLWKQKILNIIIK
ncbi:MAG: HTTM domain-containing protein [Cyclobacteriaceae bacterium]|nr:HTTM domain-containing protein [Cyclobacteriaceae bacterium]